MLEDHALLQAVLRTINGAYVIVFDEHGNYIRVWSDERLDQMYNLPMKSLEGKHLSLYAPSSIVNDRIQILHDVKEKGHVVSDEGIIVTPNGIFYNDATLAPIRKPNRDIEYVLANIREISELKNYENVSMLNFLLEQSKEIYFRYHLRQHAFEFISPCVFDILGYEPADMMDFTMSRFLNIIHPEDRDKVRGVLKNIKNNRIENSFKVYFRIQDKAGHYFVLNNNCGLVRDQQGIPVTLVGKVDIHNANSDQIFRVVHTEKFARLSNRERQVLALLSRGLTSSEIAEQLFISPLTVKTHRQNIYNKLETRSITGLMRYATAFSLV